MVEEVRAMARTSETLYGLVPQSSSCLQPFIRWVGELLSPSARKEGLKWNGR